MCPLARQGDFYVPEVKETERKSRGPAEATDAQMDGTGMDGGTLCGASPWTCGAWFRRLLHGWVGTVGVQAKLDRGGERRRAYPGPTCRIACFQIHGSM